MSQNKQADIKLIHVAKAKLGMDDESYRQLLHGLFGVDSSTKLNGNQRSELIDKLKAKGFVKTTKHIKPNAAPSKTALISKVGALLADMQLPWAYADGLVAKMYLKQKLEKLIWCTPLQLRGVITALTNKQTKLKASTQPQNE